MNHTKLVSRNIVLLPSREVSERAVAASRTLDQSFRTLFTLNDSDRLPHLTLHQLALPRHNLQTLLSHVTRVVQAVSPFSVSLSSYSVFGGSLVFWDALLSDPLQRLHEALVTVSNPLREGYIMPQLGSWLTQPSPISSAQRESLGQWGNLLAMDEFRPHITLTACEHSPAADSAVHSLDTCEMSFRAESLHIAEVGPHGTCPGSLQEFRFGG